MEDFSLEEKKVRTSVWFTETHLLSQPAFTTCDVVTCSKESWVCTNANKKKKARVGSKRQLLVYKEKFKTVPVPPQPTTGTETEKKIVPASRLYVVGYIVGLLHNMTVSPAAAALIFYSRCGLTGFK